MEARRQPKKYPIFRFTTKSPKPPSLPDASDNPPNAPPSTEAPANPPGRSEHPATKMTDASPGEQVDAAKKALDGFKPIHPGLQTAAGLVGQAGTGMTSIQNIEPILQPLKLFNSFVTTLSNVHPYVKFALGILTGASQLLINQAKLDNEVSGLLDMVKDVYEFLMEKDTIAKIDNMKETLRKISQEIKDAAEFIIKYTKKKNFVVRIADSIVHDPQTIADAHVKNLGDLMQQYRDRTVRDVQVNMYRVLEDLNLEGMVYAGDAGLNTTKKCLDGTRSEILKEITDWITDCDDKAPRILWLHGQAGRGKSAIAHTIALWAKDLGVLGSCFCFARERQAERREGKILTTIARDLADRNPAFRRALSNIVSNDSSLKTTSDVLQQWKRFILDPLSEINGEMAGNVVVIIDALDESGPPSSREAILRLLASPEAAQLPFRILLTSRVLLDIERCLRDPEVTHVKATSLDDIPQELAERDMGLYVTEELDRVPGIGWKEIQNVVKKSDGLFEWARLACAFIKPAKAGETPKERYDDLMTLESEEGRTLLDTTYFAILKGGIPQSGKGLERFRSVMHQIVMTLEPLPMTALDRMRKKFPNKEDHYEIILILKFMSPVLGGIVDCSSPVRPLHASFYDFLMDESRSGVYCVATSDTKDLAFATLQTLCDELRFNICGLESSYLANVEVPDLLERINKNILPDLSYSCRFWTQHLEKSEYEPALGKLVKDIIGSERIMFWLETMSLLGVVGKGVDALASVVTWLPGEDDLRDTLALAEDGIKFIQNFGSMMWHSTPHLYVSALPFIPLNTLLSAVLLLKFSYLARVAVGGLRDWPAIQLLLHGHIGSVNSIAFSPDGKRIVSGGNDQTVRVWDVVGGVQIGSALEGHKSSVTSVGFSPDGKRIVSGSEDNTVRVWDVEGGVWICNTQLEGHTYAVTSVGFSPDGKKIVSGSWDNTVRVWDIEGGVWISSTLEGHTSAVTSVGFSPDGKRIVSGSDDQTVRVWDVQGGVWIGSTQLEGHTYAVTSVGFSPDGKKIVSGSVDNTVRMWDVEGGVWISSTLEGHTSTVTSVGFSPDGKRIVSGSHDLAVRVWDVEGDVWVGSPLEGHTSFVTSVGFSPDGKKIVSGSWDESMRVWDVEGGVQIGSSLQGHTSGVTSVGTSPDGKKIVSGSWDKIVRVWDVEGGVWISSTLEGHASTVTSVGISPDGKRIVSGSLDSTVRVWDVEGGVWICSTQLEGHTNAVTSVGFSTDGKRIVSGSVDNTVRVWDVEGGVWIGSPLEGHADIVTSVGISPDGKRAVSGSYDQTVRVWDVEGGVWISSILEGHISTVTSVGISPDGKRIVSGSSDCTVRVWDVEGGVWICSTQLEGHTYMVNSVGFSTDGKRIVSGSWDNTVRVWDVEGGVWISSTLEGHTSGVTSVGISPDGKRIVSGSLDNTVRVWDGVKKYHICLSSLPSHALPNSDQLVHGFTQHDSMWAEPVKLQHDGWIRGPRGRLLLWIPPAQRIPFYSMWNTAVIPMGCCMELDLSQMAHGQDWWKCFKTAV